jgi:sugar phosphate isomerase/epimerase
MKLKFFAGCDRICQARLGETSSAKILRFIDSLGHRLGHLHLSDNKGERDDHLPLGSGTIDFKRPLRALTVCE